MPLLKVQEPRQPNAAIAAVSRGNRFANSIGRFFETPGRVDRVTMLSGVEQEWPYEFTQIGAKWVTLGFLVFPLRCRCLTAKLRGALLFGVPLSSDDLAQELALPGLLRRTHAT